MLFSHIKKSFKIGTTPVLITSSIGGLFSERKINLNRDRKVNGILCKNIQRHAYRDVTIKNLALISENENNY